MSQQFSIAEAMNQNTSRVYDLFQDSSSVSHDQTTGRFPQLTLPPLQGIPSYSITPLGASPLSPGSGAQTTTTTAPYMPPSPSRFQPDARRRSSSFPVLLSQRMAKMAAIQNANIGMFDPFLDQETHTGGFGTRRKSVSCPSLLMPVYAPSDFASFPTIHEDDVMHHIDGASSKSWKDVQSRSLSTNATHLIPSTYVNESQADTLTYPADPFSMRLWQLSQLADNQAEESQQVGNNTISSYQSSSTPHIPVDMQTSFGAAQTSGILTSMASEMSGEISNLIDPHSDGKTQTRRRQTDNRPSSSKAIPQMNHTTNPTTRTALFETVNSASVSNRSDKTQSGGGPIRTKQGTLLPRLSPYTLSHKLDPTPATDDLAEKLSPTTVEAIRNTDKTVLKAILHLCAALTKANQGAGTGGSRVVLPPASLNSIRAVTPSQSSNTGAIAPSKPNNPRASTPSIIKNVSNPNTVTVGLSNTSRTFTAPNSNNKASTDGKQIKVPIQRPRHLVPIAPHPAVPSSRLASALASLKTLPKGNSTSSSTSKQDKPRGVIKSSKRKMNPQSRVLESETEAPNIFESPLSTAVTTTPPRVPQEKGDTK